VWSFDRAQGHHNYVRVLSLLEGRAPHRDLTEEPQGVGFVALFLMRPGKLQGPLRLSIRLVRAAGQQICLLQPDHSACMVDHEMHRQGLLDRLL
jgi:hypothetical protein